jgi:hypothetical protein
MVQSILEIFANFSYFEKPLMDVLVTSDAGLDRRVDLLDIHQAELQLVITLLILL